MWELWAPISSLCLGPQRGSCWWLILETRSTGLSALRTRWRVTGPGCLGLKCVKTGSLITVFGNASKKWLVIVTFLFCFSSAFMLICPVCLGGTRHYHAQQGTSDDETGEHSLLFSAANHGAPFYKVVAVDGVPLCCYISLTWLHFSLKYSLLSLSLKGCWCVAWWEMVMWCQLCMKIHKYNAKYANKVAKLNMLCVVGFLQLCTLWIFNFANLTWQSSRIVAAVKAIFHLKVCGFWMHLFSEIRTDLIIQCRQQCKVKETMSIIYPWTTTWRFRFYTHKST